MRPDALRVADWRRDGDAWRADGRVPEDLRCFDGHFPGHPIVPGFVQLACALSGVRTVGAGDAPLAAIDALSASIGWPLSGSVLSMSIRRNFTLRSARSAASNCASCGGVGRLP